jgi:hypothetical protein
VKKVFARVLIWLILIQSYSWCQARPHESDNNKGSSAYETAILQSKLDTVTSAAVDVRLMKSMTVQVSGCDSCKVSLQGKIMTAPYRTIKDSIVANSFWKVPDSLANLSTIRAVISRRKSTDTISIWFLGKNY